MLTAYPQLSRIRQQLNPAHRDLQRTGFLTQWTYRRAVSSDDWILTYWPGPKFFQDHDGKGQPWRSTGGGATTPALPQARAQTTASEQLLQELLEVCGDDHNAAAYRQAIRDYPANLLRMVLGETRHAARARRIGATRGAFFFETLHRLAAHWPQALSPSSHPSSPSTDTDPAYTHQPE